MPDSPPEPLPEGIQEPDWKINPARDLEAAILTVADVQRRSWDAIREMQTIQSATSDSLELAGRSMDLLPDAAGRAAEAAITKAMEGIQANLKSVAETTSAFLDEDRKRLAAMQAQIDRNTATIERMDHA